MKIKLDRMGKSYCKGPLVCHGLIERPWPIGDTRVIDDSIAHQILSKFPGLFSTVGQSEILLEKIKEKPKNKVYEDKIDRPKGIK